MDTNSLANENHSYLSWNLIVVDYSCPIKEMWNWCNENVSSADYKNSSYMNEPYGKEVLSSCFFFKKDSDLLAFKLRFGV